MPRRARTTIIMIAACAAIIAADVAVAEVSTLAKAVEVSRLYRDCQMFEKAKEVLVGHFADSSDGQGADQILYELGVILYLEGNSSGAVTQWMNLLERFESGPFVDAARSILAEVSLRADLQFGRQLSDIAFNEQIEFSLRFWNYEDASKKMDWADIQDPWRAYMFYEQMLTRYSDPRQQVTILYLQFILASGQNSDSFGYRHSRIASDGNKSLLVHCLGSDPWADAEKVPHEQRLTALAAIGSLWSPAFEAECQRIIDRMAAIDSSSWMVADAYFRMGMLTSGSAFLSGDLKVNANSKVYFEKMLEVTPPDTMNYRRVFASYWLAQYDEKLRRAATISKGED